MPIKRMELPSIMTRRFLLSMPWSLNPSRYPKLLLTKRINRRWFHKLSSRSNLHPLAPPKTTMPLLSSARRTWSACPMTNSKPRAYPTDTSDDSNWTRSCSKSSSKNEHVSFGVSLCVNVYEWRRKSTKLLQAAQTIISHLKFKNRQCYGRMIYIQT